MNLREARVELKHTVNFGKIEDFFKREAVAAQYAKVTASDEFKKELEEATKRIAKLVEDLAKEDDRIREVTSRQSILENVRVNIMTNAISNAMEQIALEGVPAEEAIIKIITVDFAIEIIHFFSSCLTEKIESIMIANFFESLMSNPSETLLS